MKWLYKTPMAFKLAVFFAGTAFIEICTRFIGVVFFGRQDVLANWADAKYFFLMWLMFTSVYYFGWLLFRLFRERQ